MLRERVMRNRTTGLPDRPGSRRCRPRRPQGRSATRRLAAAWLAALLLLLGIQESHATNGLNLIGSGGMSSAVAGADTAVATDFTAMNTNPAGLTQIRGRHAGLSIGTIRPLTKFSNSRNDADGQDDPFVIPQAGYVQHLADTPVTVGIGFFTVGGLAADYTNLRTQFGTTDKTNSQLRHYKITPSLAYQVTENLSVGVSLALSYSDVSLAIIPNTPGGFETLGTCNRANGVAPPGTCAFAFGFTPQYGALYKVTDQVTLGVSYTSRVNLPFSSGKVSRNVPGIGRVTYDADVSGFKWADNLAVGLAWRPTSNLLLSYKFQWVNWDGSLNSPVINLRNGTNPMAPTGSIILPYNWRDQYVNALGVYYEMTDTFHLHGGYNYGNNPVPKSTIDPTSANIIEHHLVGGFAYKFTPTLKLDTMVTYAIESESTYNSSRWGNNVTSQTGGYEVIFYLSWWPQPS